MRVVTGIQPSGRLHFGNYLGAIRPLLHLQELGHELFCFIADLHALTTVHDGAVVRRHVIELAVDLLALGVDPTRVALFRQSQVPEVTKLAWVLASVWPLPWLERAHAYKDKVRRGASANVGLFTYPVLMAADVLLYEADLVPVGPDQKQNLELTRDACGRLNATYPSLALREPRPLVEATVVPGTDGRKMSKSYGNTLELFAPLDQIRSQVMHIVTDSTGVGAPKPRPAPLYDSMLLATSDPQTRSSFESSWSMGGVGYGTYKEHLIKEFMAMFALARERRAALANSDVEHVLELGAARARVMAAKVWARVADVAGLSR